MATGEIFNMTSGQDFKLKEIGGFTPDDPINHPNDSLSRKNDIKKTTNEPAFIKDLFDDKFRYQDVYCVVKSKVELKSGNFIHANKIDCGEFGEFIAAQGPLPNTIDDFLDMVKENNCKIVLMLTRPVEYGNVKCTNYYDESNQWYNTDSKYSLHTSKSNSTDIEGLTQRNLTFKRKIAGRPYNFMHFLYEIWPDKNPLDEFKLHDLVSGLHPLFDEAKKKKEKIIVHCSAGIGRTGTFITAFDMFLSITKMPSENSFRERIQQYRQYRYGFVQNIDQFNSIIKFAQLFLICKISEKIDVFEMTFDQEKLAIGFFAARLVKGDDYGKILASLKKEDIRSALPEVKNYLPKVLSDLPVRATIDSPRNVMDKAILLGLFNVICTQQPQSEELSTNFLRDEQRYRILGDEANEIRRLTNPRNVTRVYKHPLSLALYIRQYFSFEEYKETKKLERNMLLFKGAIPGVDDSSARTAPAASEYAATSSSPAASEYAATSSSPAALEYAATFSAPAASEYAATSSSPAASKYAATSSAPAASEYAATSSAPAAFESEDFFEALI